jgi:glycosyltransferase involved in cell wall biosynthesis
MFPEVSKTVLPARAETTVSGNRAGASSLGKPDLAGLVDQSRSVRAGSTATHPEVSIIIPARNEERWLTGTLQAAIAAVGHARSQRVPAEIIVVDNHSADATWAVLQQYVQHHEIRAVRLTELGAARARNCGRRTALGRILVFVDADTHLPADALMRIMEWCDRHGKEAGITRLAALDGGWKAWIWWTFWEHVRRLPISYAKAMPAVMFCTANVFDEFGPFDEEVAIGEEWPILASLYRHRPRSFVYDRTLTGFTSSRRMERQRFGYLRTLVKYVWAILHKPGRIHYTDRIR